MALRMNLLGVQMSDVYEELGRGDDALIEAASSLTSAWLRQESDREKALCWLETLVRSGCLPRTKRSEPAVPDDGGLLVTYAETEIHVVAFDSLVRSISADDLLDVSNQSSNWHHSAIVSLYNDLSACEFLRSEECSRELFAGMNGLINGTPVFGDAFQTQWSFYSVLEKEIIVRFSDALRVASEFERSVPEYVPAEVREGMTLRLSENANRFATDLAGWLEQIANAGQDAYVVWN